MTAQHSDSKTTESSDGSASVGRRGLFAWAATLAGAGLAWMSGSGRAEASHNASGTAGADRAALHVNQVNTGTARSFLLGNHGSPPLVVLHEASAYSIGTPDAIQGISDKPFGAGVRGRGDANNSAIGVIGDTLAHGTGVVGVVGATLPNPVPAGVGVYGLTYATSGIGVRGQIPPENLEANTIAMYAENFSPNAGAGPGAGGFGCYGYSAKGHGLVGATGTAGGGALIGSTNGVPGAYAGIFYGQMVVLGAKNAAVPDPDGGHRLLYCMESPESWFEDFGRATLANGCATVTIDPEFAKVADLSDYTVFLTPYGDTKGIHIAAQSASTFTVQENARGTSDIGFAWRLVAKRKDIEAPRLAKVTLPAEPQRRAPLTPNTMSQPAVVPAPTTPKPWLAKHSHPAAARQTTKAGAARPASPPTKKQ